MILLSYSLLGYRQNFFKHFIFTTSHFPKPLSSPTLNKKYSQNYKILPKH